MAAVAYSVHPSSPVKSWNELVAIEDYFDDKDQWAFRGQNVNDFPATSLQRHCEKLGLKGLRVADLEVKLVREFARRYHLYGGSALPPKGHTLQWLTLLQHYGTPTRLLDFTYSFFIAAYFAVEAAVDASVIWAVNVSKLRAAGIKLIQKTMLDGTKRIADYQENRDAASFRALFMSPSPQRFVYSVNPIRLNERLTIQQGIFLTPGDVTLTLEQNLQAIPDHKKIMLQIVLDRRCWSDVLRKLHRMGINRASLFPGLEGFAWSLRTKSLILAHLPVQDVKMLEQV